MIELITAWRYLTSRRSRRSSGYLVFASVGVLALAIWLVITSLSVAHGIEGRWSHQIADMTGDLRITPTSAWSQSLRQDEGLADFSIDDDSFLTLLASPSSSPAVHSLQKLHHYLTSASLRHRCAVAPFFGTIVELQLTFGQIDNPYGNRHTIEQFCYLTNLQAEHPYYRPLSTDPVPQLLLPRYLSQKFHLQSYSLASSHLSYHAMTPFGSKKQRMEIALGGEYDAGILPLPLLLAPPELVSYLRQSQGAGQQEWNCGWQVWLKEEGSETSILPERLLKLQQEIQHWVKETGGEEFWRIENYGELPFTREIVNELLNQRALFMILGGLMVAVATTNIAMLLHLLVRDRAQEIAILYALGASRKQIVAIFTLAGAGIGIASASLGLLGSIITLANLNPLIDLISMLQGREFLSEQLYGARLAVSPSLHLLCVTGATTLLLALLSSLLPAWQATKLQPSELLKE